MVKIAVIKYENEFGEIHPGIDSNDWTEEKLNDENLKESIEDFVKLIDIKNTNELLDLINKINSKGYTNTIDEFYYDSDYVYQAIFIYRELSEKLSDINRLATQFIYEKMHVLGDMIIIKRSIINNDFDYVNLTMDDLLNVLRSQFIHTAIIIKPNGELIEKYYVHHPLEINFGQEIDNTRIHQSKVIDFVLNFHIDIKTEKTQSNYNKYASNIYKKNIYGNVLVSLCDNTDHYQKNINLDKSTLQSLINIFSKKEELDQSAYSRVITLNNLDMNNLEISNGDKFKHNNFPELALCPNFYYIIKKENDKYLNLPNLILKTDILKDVLNDIE